MKRKIIKTDDWITTKGTKVIFIHGKRPNIIPFKTPKNPLRAITINKIIVKGNDIIKLMETGQQAIIKGLCKESYYIRKDCVYKTNGKKYTLWQGIHKFVRSDYLNISNINKFRLRSSK